MSTVSEPAILGKSKIPAGRGASRRLAKILRTQLTSGRFGPGDRLPTHRVLMHQFKVGYSVANRAMEILAREGLIQRQQGQGSFVSEKAADAQRAGPSDTFALVLAHPSWSFNLSLYQGSDTVAGRLHSQTLVCDTENNVDRQASVLMQLIASRVAGIALVPTTEPETPECQIRVCQEYGIPVVLLHRGVQGASAPLISLPFEEIGYRAGTVLVELGHHCVACIFDERYEATNQYEAGLRRALDERGGARQDLRVYCAGRHAVPMTPEYEAFLEELLVGMFYPADQQRPTAILAIDENQAEWVYVRLMKMGVRVPEEMSLITVGSTMRRRVIDQQLSAVTIDEMGAGRLAAQLLSEMGRRQRPINDSEQFTAELGFHAGQTLGPAPPVAAM